MRRERRGGLCGDTASGRSGPSIWRRVLYIVPPSPFGLVARLAATHKRAENVSGPGKLGVSYPPGPGFPNDVRPVAPPQARGQETGISTMGISTTWRSRLHGEDFPRTLMRGSPHAAVDPATARRH